MLINSPVVKEAYQKTACIIDAFDTHEYGTWVEDHALEGAVVDVLVVVGDVNPPLSGFVGLERGVEGSVVLAHRTTQGPVSRRISRHFKQLGSGGMVRVDQNFNGRSHSTGLNA